MADMKKYLDTVALGTLVDQIKSEDAKVLAAAKKYTDDSAKLFDGAGSAATAESNAKAYTDALANGAVATNTAAITKLNANAETEGSVDYKVAAAKALIDADVDAVEGKADKNAEDIAAINNAESGVLAQAKKYADDEVAKVQGAVDTLDAFVGDIPEGYEETNVIAYINKKAQETLDSASGGSSESAASVLAALNTYKAENDPKVTANATAVANAQTAADNAQTAADAAQSHSEGVAADLAKETKAREDADTAQVKRIVALEETIVGLSGAMHFEGVKDAVPEDVSGYEQGDVIIVGNKEYVLNGEAFVEFGDASVNAEAITALTGRVDTLVSDMTQAKTDIDNAEAAILLKAEQTALDAEVERATGAESELNTRLQAVEAKFTGDGDGSVADQIADAKNEAIASAAETAQEKATAAETAAKEYAKGLDDAMKLRVDALEAVDHEHANKALLDTYTQTEANLADAVAKKHEHANADVLAAITAAKVSAWDAAEQAAKTYADGLNSAMTTKVDGAIERIGVLETGIATKAEKSDLNAAVERIAQNELDIASNTSAINSFTAITSEEVNALFA